MSQEVDQAELTEYPLQNAGVAIVAKDSSTQQDLVVMYYDFVETVVTRLMRSMALPFALKDDFMSAGALGLVEAAGRFNPERGTDFKIFAFLRIRGAVIDYLRSSCELSGGAYRMLRSLSAAHELREQELECKQTKPLARAPSKTRRAGQVIDFLAKSALAFSLCGVDAAATQSVVETPEHSLEKKQASEELRHLVATLPEKERLIIEQHYFHDRSLVDIAENSAGLSKSWVSRLHDRALGLLREKIAEVRRTAELPKGPSAITGRDDSAATKRVRRRDRSRSRRGRGKSRPK
jgi:RNA polymerase sigma factor for flagellar operon FliA